MPWNLPGWSARPLRLRENGVLVDGKLFPARRVTVLAFGKAALGMIRGAHQSLGSIISRGLVVTDEAGEVPEWAETIVAGHPIPNDESVRAAHAAITLVEAVTPDDLLVALVSGGGSALLEAPVEGLSLDDTRDLNSRLIRSGAPIEVINGVRQAVSMVKAGRLAGRCRGNVATLIVSDVGDDPAVVASGPTVAAPLNTPDISDVFDRFSIEGRAAEQARKSARSPASTDPSWRSAGPAPDPGRRFSPRGGPAAGYLSGAGLDAETRRSALGGTS